MSGARPILLFGAAGQVGWELRRTLASLGHPIVAADRKSCDLTDVEALAGFIAAAAPKLLVNAAAYTAVDAAESDEATAFAVNATAPGVMAAAAAGLGIPLVHYSTDYVFDGRPIIDLATGAPRPYRETDPTAPLGAYGRSKLAGEEAVRAAGGEHLVLRTAWVYAARGRNFLLTIRQMAGEREELRIVADQIGAPTWARQIAEATALILARCWRSRTTGSALSGCSGTYHLTAGGQTSWHGFAEAIVGAMPREERKASTIIAIATADFPRPARRPTWSLLDNHALADTFGVMLPDWRQQLALCLDLDAFG